MADKYILQVTTGTEYDVKTHKIVPVNTGTPIQIESDLISASLNVRIQSYRGLPPSSPSTSPYFSVPPHNKNNDHYSIAFTFTPKKAINGNDLVFGNDFDHPIRDRLPPGFSTALKIVKWAVDPGLDGDPYADKPYLYGSAGGSFNRLFVGGKSEDKEGKGEVLGGNKEAGILVEEGGDEEGSKVRKEFNVPEGDAARKKFFLNEENRKAWTWEVGRTYAADFFNPYLDFNEFALKLPGFTLPIMKYWDGQGLRYVLKNRATDEVLLVILFTLYLKEDIDENGNVKPGVQESANTPFDLRDEGTKEKHGRGKKGWWWGSAEEKDEGGEEGKEDEVVKEPVKEPVKAVEDTSADDVD